MALFCAHTRSRAADVSVRMCGELLHHHLPHRHHPKAATPHSGHLHSPCVFNVRARVVNEHARVLRVGAWLACLRDEFDCVHACFACIARDVHLFARIVVMCTRVLRVFYACLAWFSCVRSCYACVARVARVLLVIKMRVRMFGLCARDSCVCSV